MNRWIHSNHNGNRIASVPAMPARFGAHREAESEYSQRNTRQGVWTAQFELQSEKSTVAVIMTGWKGWSGPAHSSISIDTVHIIPALPLSQFTSPLIPLGMV
jgi:hypothetical protein